MVSRRRFLYIATCAAIAAQLMCFDDASAQRYAGKCRAIQQELMEPFGRVDRKKYATTRHVTTKDGTFWRSGEHNISIYEFEMPDGTGMDDTYDTKARDGCLKATKINPDGTCTTFYDFYHSEGKDDKVLGIVDETHTGNKIVKKGGPGSGEKQKEYERLIARIYDILRKQ